MPEPQQVQTTLIILGACSAVAQAYVRRVANEHTHFLLLARQADRLEIIRDDLQARGASAQCHALDLADCSSHESWVNRLAQDAQGGCSVLVFYGTLPDQELANSDTGVALEAINTNFNSVVSWLNLMVDCLGDKLRSIVVLSSVAGDRGRQSNYIYGAAKGGLALYLQGLRNRLAESGTQVITVKPGFIDTPMTAHIPDKGVLWASPEKIAADIDKAVQRKRDVVYTPWFWRYIMLVIRLIPECLFKKLKL